MKKLLSIILLSAITLSAYAQSQSPRYGTASNQDNTGRALTYGLITKADTAGAVTDTIVTNFISSKGQSSYNTDFVITLTDSVAIAANTLRGCFLGDRLTFIINNTAGAGHKVFFAPYRGNPIGFQTSTAGDIIAPSSGSVSTISFIFNGTVWVETSRAVK